MPTIAAFLNEEIGTITSMISESSDEMQKAHLMRLCTDLGIIRQALDGVVAMSAALLQDRQEKFLTNYL